VTRYNVNVWLVGRRRNIRLRVYGFDSCRLFAARVSTLYSPLRERVAALLSIICSGICLGICSGSGSSSPALIPSWIPASAPLSLPGEPNFSPSTLQYNRVSQYRALDTCSFRIRTYSRHRWLLIVEEVIKWRRSICHLNLTSSASRLRSLAP
jgi:hypothetical protein